MADEPTTLASRVGVLEGKVQALESLPARMAAVEGELVTLRVEMRDGFGQLRAEMRGQGEGLRREMRELNDETRRQMVELNDETHRHMRVLHEDVISRLAVIQEGQRQIGRAHV